MNHFHDGSSLFFHENPQPMWIFQTDTLRIVEVNNAAIIQYGYSRAEFMELTIKNLRPEEDLQLLTDCIKKYKPCEKNVWETRHKDKAGKVFFVKVYASPLEYNGVSCWLTTVQNIQETLDFKQEIAEKAYKLQQVLDNSLDVICAFDKEGCFVECSKASIQIWGYTPEELLGQQSLDFVYEEDRSLTLKAGKFITGGENVTNFQNRYIKKDGTLISILWSARWDSEKEIMFCIAKDATEKVQAENKIKDQADRVNDILERITDSFFAVDTDWKVTYWNQEAEKLLQRPRAEILNQNLWEVYQDAIPLKFYSEYHRALREQVAVHFEEYFDPLQIWLEVTAYPSLGGLSVFFKDITEKINIQKAIRESKERYDIIAKATNDIIWDWNLVTDEAIWNDAFKAILGYKTTKGCTSGSSWIEHVHPDDRQRVKESISKVLKKSGKWEEEYRFRCADGTYKYFLDRAFLIKDNDGKPVRMIGSMQDISQLKIKQKEIEERNQRILEIAHSNSHLVRKPLANILGVTQLLAEKEDNEHNELLQLLKESALELDFILKEVAEKTLERDYQSSE